MQATIRDTHPSVSRELTSLVPVYDHVTAHRNDPSTNPDEDGVSLLADVFRAYVPGNIPFHSSLTEPILDELRHRLSFLNGTSESKSEHSEVS
jgi:hypothetical protein